MEGDNLMKIALISPDGLSTIIFTKSLSKFYSKSIKLVTISYMKIIKKKLKNGHVSYIQMTGGYHHRFDLYL